MPTAYGSVERPVSLDPFQNIVEVGWATVKYIAVSIALNRTATPDFPETGIPTPTPWPWNWTSDEADPDLPENSSSLFRGTYLTGFQYDKPEGSNSIVIGTAAWRKGLGWKDGVSVEVTAGEPSLPQAFSFSAWQYLADIVIGPPRISFWPQAEWVAPLGDAFVDPDAEDIIVPHYPDLHFALGDTATIQMRGTAFIGSPGIYRLDTVPHIVESPPGTFQVVGIIGSIVEIPASENTVTFAPLDIALSAMTVTALGKDWHPVAYRPVGPTLNEEDPNQVLNAGVVWVLCEKEV